MATNESITKVEDFEKIKVKLDGHELILDPNKSGMFEDDLNKYTLHFFSEGHDRIVFKKEMDPTVILKNIKAGILRVSKDGKDVTKDFGGQPFVDWSRQPIVEGGSRRTVSKTDIPLINLLNRNKESEIIRDINSIKDYSMLNRLKELEEMGKNPTSNARGNVLDVIVDAIKRTPGVSEAKEVPEGKKDAVSVK